MMSTLNEKGEYRQCDCGSSPRVVTSYGRRTLWSLEKRARSFVAITAIYPILLFTEKESGGGYEDHCGRKANGSHGTPLSVASQAREGVLLATELWNSARTIA